MNNDSHLIFEAYKNRPVNENMPYPAFAKLSKHAASKLPSKESLEDWETRMKKLGCDITKDIKTGTYHAWHGPEHTSSYRTHGENEEKPVDKFKDQMPDSKEEYSAHDYAKEMEVRGEGEESRIDPKCWKGYHKQGTKLKGGVRVNNCVKSQNDEEEGKLMTHMKQIGMIAKGAKVTLPPHETEEEEKCTCGCSDCPDRAK